jgi:splicing suppressor protein 51
MTLSEMDTRLAKWISFHNPTLMGACIHALALPRDISRSRTHVLRMVVAPRTDHGGSVAKYFRVLGAEPIEIAQAMKYHPPWPESLNDLKKLREENEQSGRGTVAAIGVICPPLGVQIVPFGSLKGLSSLQVLPHWKETLTEDVENGKKFTRFGY